MISFISIKFLLFVTATCFLYFVFPLKSRWIILLVSSLYFYSCSGIVPLLFMLIIAGIVYITTLNIEKIYISHNSDKRKAKCLLLLGVMMTICLLIYIKAGRMLAETMVSILSMEKMDFQIIIPLGISYYTFSVIGYMADVYWKKETVEHNYLKLLLYMIYFPHILQGPIPRHKKLSSQLVEGHSFDYQNLCYGLQRMAWGYFKKMVIADRFAILTKAVFNNYMSYEGIVFVVAIFFATIELYCDFSGCMDIALGVSEVMSVKLDENFQRPFFSKSVGEFWRRWHITLGTWFKDYIYLPLVINPTFIKICYKTKKIFGSRFAKSLISAIPLAIVWFLTGLWHGTGLNYIVWGCYWGILIILSTLFAPEMKKITKILKINTKSKWFSMFQIARTFIFFLISRILTVPGDIKVTWEIIQKIFMKGTPPILNNQIFYAIGLDQYDFWVGMIAILILFGVEFMQEKGIKVREKIAMCPLIFRWGIYYIGIFVIVVFGIYGSELGTDTFIYMNY